MRNSSFDVKQHLLGDAGLEDGNNDQPELRVLYTQRRMRHLLSRWIRIGYMVVLHLALGLSILSLFNSRSNHPLKKCLHTHSFSPASSAISYEIRHSWPSHHSPYAGPPSPDSNEAWNVLTRPTYFNATAEELIAAGESVEDSVELVGGGYVASTSVYHDIHCLRQIKLYLYKDTYYPNLTHSQEQYLIGHVDHCIEALRTSIMCTGDVSVYTFRWHDPPREKPETKTNSKRACVNWDKLDEWGRSRMVEKDPAVKGNPGKAQ